MKHYNYIKTDTEYKNLNAERLTKAVLDFAFPDFNNKHFWITFSKLKRKQYELNIGDLTEYIKKGQHGVKIVYPKNTFDEKGKPEFGTTILFHISQLEIKPKIEQMIKKDKKVRKNKLKAFW